MKKLLIIGIDGAFPEFIFGEWLDELPNIKKILIDGSYGKLNSTIPPLSVTAWSSIYTGKSPTDTGIFEYTYRKKFSYEDVRLVTSHSLKEKTFWQILSDNNKKSLVCYPILAWPIRPFNGWLISGSLTPSGKNVDSVYPSELKQEIETAFGEVPTPDVPFFRDLSKEDIVREVQALTEKQIEVEKYLLRTKEWDACYVLIGLSDRMNHSFWKYLDKGHRKHESESFFKNTLKDYYKFVDKKIGEFVEIVDNDTKIIILSDHGIMRMHTRVNLTDWLIKHEYMVLKEPVNERKEFNFDMVDWSKTRAFAIGAYEAQIFLNMRGREPLGIVDEIEADNLLEEIISGLEKITGDDGKTLDTKFFRKKNYFKGKYGREAPDLVVYFDNLQYGCNTTLIGNETLWSPQTARGSDDAGHSTQGIFIMRDGKNKNKNLGEISYLDVAPTILQIMGIEIPEDMIGKTLSHND